ncbi:MAG: cupin domain-containing protein [Patescibacteria group bacterium]
MKFFPKRVDKPWGYESWWAHNDKYVGKLIHVDANKRLSWQYHTKKDETMFCLSGNAVLVHEQDGKVIEETLKPGESFRISPGTKHRLKAGAGGCDVLEASTPEVDDVVRLEDDYGREAPLA